MRTKVVGVIYPNADGSSRQQILKRMRKEGREYEAVYFEPEPGNAYNKIAVKVLNKDKEQLGYLSAELSTDIAKRIFGGEKLFAVITSFTGGYEDNSIVECNIEIMSAQTDTQNVIQEEQHKQHNISNSTLAAVVAVVSIIAFAIWATVIKKNIETNKSAANPYTHSYLQTSLDFVVKPTITTSEDLKALSDFRKSLDKKLEEQRKAEAYELNELRKKMTSTYDEVTGTKWIYEKTTKKMVDRRSSRKNLFYVYLGQDKATNHMWPRLYMGFIKDGWIFFDKVLINIDGDTRRLYFHHFDVMSDVLGAGVITEYIDLSAGDYEGLIKSMSKGKKVIVRFEGPQYYHDFTMSKEQKNALANIWRLYELMRPQPRR